MSSELSAKDRHLLLKLARENILRQFGEKHHSICTLEKQGTGTIFKENRGTFVTLHKKNGDLRGCIGNIEPVKPLVDGVRDNARHAAFNDSRFSALSRDELDDVVIEISILSLPEKIEYRDAEDLVEKLRPGIDGVIIEKGSCRATFLPQVWDQLSEPEDFLGHLCSKAGLDVEQWKSGTLNVSRYQVQSFEEAP